MANQLKLFETFFNAVILLILLLLFYIYYFQQVIKNYSEGITNTAKYENKLTQIEPPVFELCLDPFFKPSVFEKYNISSYIFYANDYPDVLINNTILDIFDEATYHLNEDFTILMYGEDDLQVYLKLGENRVQWKEDKILDFEVKKIRTEFHGNC